MILQEAQDLIVSSKKRRNCSICLHQEINRLWKKSNRKWDIHLSHQTLTIAACFHLRNSLKYKKLMIKKPKIIQWKCGEIMRKIHSRWREFLKTQKLRQLWRLVMNFLEVWQTSPYNPIMKNYKSDESHNYKKMILYTYFKITYFKIYLKGTIRWTIRLLITKMQSAKIFVASFKRLEYLFWIKANLNSSSWNFSIRNKEHIWIKS